MLQGIYEGGNSMRGLVTKFALFVLMTATTPSCYFGEVALAAREQVEETRPFEPGGTFRLDNVNGTVTIVAWDQENVRIGAEKAANNEKALESIEVEIDGEGDWVEVKTRLPRSRSFFGSGGKVDYFVQIPARATIQVETVNGKLEVEGIQGQVRASTVNGSVHIFDVSGEVESSTVNGSIEATYIEVDAKGRHRFSTTNGSVTLRLPTDASGEFEARTVNGSIRTDFPLEVSGKYGHRRLRGRLGEGKGTFDINTINGSVKILES
jgi:DUF4097 and DUF4098 domain-containing protein YvlB